ncbi:MAG: helix-turn-helix domain-containing protein [Vagococcus sp.]
MDFNGFLEDNQYPVLILQWLELKKSSFCSVDQLCELVGISKFRALQYVEELNQHLSLLDESSEISIYDSGEIRLKNVDNYTVKKVRAQYLLESELFLLLMDTIHFELSIDKFSEKRFLSRTKSYNKRNLLIECLKPFKLKYKKGKILGEELQIRSFLFSLYFYFFYGIHFPFDDDIRIKTQSIIKMLIPENDRALSLTQRSKLEYLISIMLVRTSKKHFCQLKQQVSIQKESETFVQFMSFFDGSTDDILDEWGYLQGFLFSEGIVIDSKYFDLSEDVENLSIQFSNKYFPENNHDFVDAFSLELQRLYLKYQLFPIYVDSFNQQRSFMFFEENYPTLITPVQVMLDEFNHILSESINETTAYYDLLLAVMKIFPINDLEEKIYVCVDFTHGNNYTRFISQQIKSFQSANIVIQEWINGYTDIFVSDFPSSFLTCKQIIWKEPPNADDWEVFGNTVIKIKEKKWVSNE